MPKAQGAKKRVKVEALPATEKTLTKTAGKKIKGGIQRDAGVTIAANRKKRLAIDNPE